MPLYAYECKQGHLTELIRKVDEREEGVFCWNCGESAHLIIAGSTPHLFGEQTFDDIAPHPVTVRSKKELEQVCRKYGCYARNYMQNYSAEERRIKHGSSEVGK